MSIYAYGNTEKCSLEINEDSYAVKKIGDYIVLIVADGNGGFKDMVNTGGMAVSIMLDYLNHIIKPKTNIIDIYNRIEEGMFTASRCFLAVNSIDERYSNIYASMSVAIIEEISLNMVFASIGNTEIRLVRNGKITRINKLFSEAYNLYEKNEISEDELYMHPKRAILTSALGVFNESKVDIIKTQLLKEDILIFTTDGLYRCMSPQQVVEKLAKNGDDINKAVDKILLDAKEAKCQDNCTMICAYIYDDNGASIEKRYEPTKSTITTSRDINPVEDNSVYNPYGVRTQTHNKDKRKRKNYLYNQ